MNELALFAGAGGGILGGHLLGWRTVCAVEWEAYPASVLCARQNDGLLESFPIWDDVQTFNGKPWRGIVDVVSGGFPCQDISAAGRGGGITASRSSMWKHMARIIGEVQPEYCFVENSPMLTNRGLGTVLGDLASMGFDAEWGVLSAADVGANHKRERMWIVAYSRCKLRSEGDSTELDTKKKVRTYSAIHNQSSSKGQFSDSTSIRLQRQRKHEQSSNSTQSKNGKTTQFEYGRSSDFWKIEPNVGRVANGVASGMDRLKAIGNGQVPLCAATAWNLLRKRIDG
jgi:DNA (cytosine-5)-methyltransferase 1